MIDKIADDWMRDMETDTEKVYGFRWGGQALLDKMSQALQGRIFGDVYEIGCGGGRMTKWLFNMGAKSVVATDVHQPALDKTKMYEPRAEVLRVDGENIRARNRKFDLVFTWGVFLHLPPYLVQHYINQAADVADRLIFSLPTPETETGSKIYRKFIEAMEWRRTYQLGYISMYPECHGRLMAEKGGWQIARTTIIADWQVLYLCQKNYI